MTVGANQDKMVHSQVHLGLYMILYGGGFYYFTNIGFVWKYLLYGHSIISLKLEEKNKKICSNFLIITIIVDKRVVST